MGILFVLPVGLKPHLDDCSRRPYLVLVSWKDLKIVMVDVAMSSSSMDN
jgi:hypothetical protein